MRIDPDRDLLLAVDLQPDFMPGGALAVPDGDAVVAPINALMRVFRHVVATQDWHPAGHVSFASSHAGCAPFDSIELAYGRQTLWPEHCVQGTAGAALHDAFDQQRVEMVLRKGFHDGVDSYSAFRENDRVTTTGLEAWLRARGFARVFLVGLALDYCVAWSAEDAVLAGFAAVVVEDACRGIGLPVDPGRTTIDAARANLRRLGVAFASTANLKK